MHFVSEKYALFLVSMPALTLALSIFVLSQSAIFIRYAEAPAAAIGFWRMILALPVLVVLLFWKRRWGNVFRLRSQQWMALFLCGFFLFAHFHTWFLSVQKTTLANAMILFGLNPLFTAIGAWIFFREKMEWRHGLALVLCLLGLYFLLEESLQLSASHFEGYVLGIICAIFFSAYVLVSKGIRRDLHNVPFALVTYTVCMVCFALLMSLTAVPFLGYPTNSWIGFAGLAFGSTLLGHSLFTHSLQFFNVNLMSISTLVEPILTAISAYILFREPLSRGAVFGFFFVTLGILAMYFPYLRDLARGKAKIHAK